MDLCVCTIVWENLNVTFDSIVGPIGDRQDISVVGEFSHPVLAMDCSPGRYPAPNHLDSLSQHFKWSEAIEKEAFSFINEKLPRPFIGIHFRTAFAQAGCGFSLHAQCGEWETDENPLSQEVCTPSLTSIESHLKAVIASMGAASIFVASDAPLAAEWHAMFSKYAPVLSLEHGLNENDGRLIPGGGGSPQIDLAILTLADHAILHCPSSFSNIAKRLRNFPNTYRATGAADAVYSSTSFWGIEKSLPHSRGSTERTEL